MAVDRIAADTTGGPEDEVQEAKHCRPVSRASLAEFREVLRVVSTKDGVDAELSPERTEIGY